MHRALSSAAAALLALAATATIALAQGGVAPPGQTPPGETPKAETLYEDGHGGRYLLGGTWRFRLDPTDAGVVLGFPGDPSIAGWSTVTVPNAWNATDLSDDSMRGTIGWYRKDFRVPARGGAIDWKIRFEAVNYHATVWLNGKPVGQHEGGYVPFEVPAEQIRRNSTNTLVIRVDSRRGRNTLPRGGDRPNGRPSGGWWNYGGLLREVYLRRFEGVDVERVRVRSVIRSRRRATLLFKVRLTNPNPGVRRVRLRTKVGARSYESKVIGVGRRGIRSVSYRIEVDKPRLWEPRRPQLYPVEVAATTNKRRVAAYRLKVGIREIEVDERGLLLINGKRVKLLGASIHEDHPTRGAALTPGDRARDMARLRELGGSIIRAHYPLHPHYLELADRMGVMVWDQVPVYQLGFRGLTIKGIMAKSLAYVEAMVLRDLNHASVLAYSIGNELSARMTDDQESYIRRSARLINRLDPTRLRTIDILGYPGTPPYDVYRELDALGINNYFGWYPGPNGQTEDRELLSPFLDQMREYYPDLALFVTEFGAEANRHGAADIKGTYTFQRDFMRHHVSTYIQKPYLNGAITWILRDFRVRPDWDGGNPRPEPPVNQKGLTDELGRKKPAFFDTARLYKSVRPVR